MSSKYYSIPVTKAQAIYLRELLDDDLELTVLTTSETQQAEAVLGRVDDLLEGLL